MNYTVQTTTQDKSIGIISSIIINGLIACLLLYFSLTTPDPPMSGGEGMVVNLGYVDESTGDIQPMNDVEEQPIITNKQMESSIVANEKIVTQSIEESEKIVTSEKETKKNTPTEKVITETKPLEQPVKNEVEPVKAINPATLYKGKSNGATSQGTSNKGTGDQGDPAGDPNSSNYGKNTGNGNNGNGDGSGVGDGKGNDRGPGFTMSGRTAKYLPSPSFNVQESGKVIVEIIIDKQGKVIRATAGIKGSTTMNATLLSIAKSAAEKAKFSANESAPEEQRGTIVYNFILK